MKRADSFVSVGFFSRFLMEGEAVDLKLKTRLIISFLMMVVLPFVMCTVVFGSLVHFPGFGGESIMGLMGESDTLSDISSDIFDVMVSLFIILVFTAIVMTAWIYMSIITPIRRLQNAAKNIRDGKYSVPMDGSIRDDEIGQLCVDFEKMRQELEENQKAKQKMDASSRELIRNISHDLKTPITSVKGYVEGILDGVASTPEKQERYLRIIYSKAEEMDALVNELTLYSQLDTNEIPYDLARISVKEFFDDCARDLEDELLAEGITFRYEPFCDEGDIILADPEKLRRAIDNIIGNSIKYIDKSEGFIRLTVKDEGSLVQIEIEDNVRGIAKEDIPYIFDRFFRTDESRNSNTGGSGIGLSIVKKIVEDHEGKIWATSDIGRGTIIFIALRKR